MKALLLSERMRYRQVMLGLAGVVILLAINDHGSAQFYPRGDDSDRSKRTTSDPWPPAVPENFAQDLTTRPSQSADATRIPNDVGLATKSTPSGRSSGPTKQTPPTNQNAFGSPWPDQSKVVVPMKGFLRRKKQADENQVPNQEPADSNLAGPQNRPTRIEKSRSTKQNAFGNAWPAQSKVIVPLKGFLGPKKQINSTQSAKQVIAQPSFQGSRNRPSAIAKSRSTQTNKNAFGRAWPAQSKVVVPMKGFLGPKKQTNPTQSAKQITAPSFRGPQNRPSPIAKSSVTRQTTNGSGWPVPSENVESRNARIPRNQIARPGFNSWPPRPNSSKSTSNSPRSPVEKNEEPVDVQRVKQPQPQPRYFSHLTGQRSTPPPPTSSVAVEDTQPDSVSAANRNIGSPVANRQRGWQTNLDLPTDLSNRTGNPVVPVRTESNYGQQDLYNNTLDPAPRRRQLDPGPTELTWSNATFDSNESNSSEVSPNHWGSLGQEVAGQFEADEQDPPIYDPATDFNRPRTSVREAWYHGRKYFSYDLMYVEPRYQENTALLISDTNSDRSVSSDFELNVGNRIGLAFESKAGPGVELIYSEFDQTSRVAATSSATTSICSHVFLAPSSMTLSLVTFSPSQTITVTQSTDLQYFDVGFFKFQKFPIAALAGHLGVRYAEIDHEHHALLTDGGGSVIGVLNQQSDYRGFGPKIGMTYVRPIGHTRFRLVGSMAGSVLAGDRNQRAEDSTGYSFVSDSSEKLISAVDLRLGVEWAYNLSSVSSVSARFAYESQHWFNGGTPVDPNSSFGLSGMIFGIGFVR